MPKSKAQPTEVTLPAALSPNAAPRQTKQQILIDLLSRPEGATLKDLANATGWQLHTIHGAMSGSLKKRLGLTITSETMTERGRVYRINQQGEPNATPQAYR